MTASDKYKHQRAYYARNELALKAKKKIANHARYWSEPERYRLAQRNCSMDAKRRRNSQTLGRYHRVREFRHFCQMWTNLYDTPESEGSTNEMCV